MGRNRRARLCAGLTLAFCLPAIVFGQTAADGWSPVTDARLLNPAPGDWPSYRRTYDAVGFSPLAKIDASNVKQLRPVWSFAFKDNSRWAPTPIVVNGIMYIAQGVGRVVAMDAVTGDVIWVHERRYPDDISISQAFPRHRGVAVYGNLVYWGTADSHLLALDARTGKMVWEVRTGDYQEGDGHNHPPLIADGKIFIGHTGGDRTVKGRFRAFDAATGKLLWTVHTAPRRGDPGYETWPNRARQEPLGAVPWNTVSYDPQLRLVYFGTGQPTPWIEDMRGVGKALYNNSILAVDADTGRIRWHFQAVPNDNWDRDAVFESMLLDLPIQGRTRKILVQTGKTGWGLVLDRTNGRFISAFRTGYENVITGWSRDGTPIMDPKFTPKPADVGSGKTFLVCPHLHGGRDLNAASYSPVTRLYYVGFNNTCMNSKVERLEIRRGRSVGASGGPATRVPGYDYVGELAAYNPVTGAKVWAYRPPGGHAMSASVLATGGGLVFAGTVDRQFFAVDAKGGQLLWQTRLSGDVSGAPVTFEVDGRQYIAIGAGGRPAQTTSFSGLTKVSLPDGGGTVSVFALPDDRDYRPTASRVAILTQSAMPGFDRATAAAPSPPAGPTPGAGFFTAAQAERGRLVFGKACSSCHSVADQTGTSFRNKWGGGTAADLFTFISTAMPENAPGSLPKPDYAAVIAFMMRESGYSAGPSELPADAKELAAVPLGPRAAAKERE